MASFHTTMPDAVWVWVHVVCGGCGWVLTPAFCAAPNLIPRCHQWRVGARTHALRSSKHMHQNQL